MIKLYGLFFLSIVLCFSGCSKDVAGTISETDSGCAVAGVVRNSKNTPVHDAAVILHNRQPADSEGRRTEDSPMRPDTVFTDPDGRFYFDAVDTGHFLIEVNYRDTLGAILPAEIEHSDTLIEKQCVVLLNGTIIGMVDSSIAGSAEKVSIIVRELGRTIPVDFSGYFSINNLPAWEYHLGIVRNNEIVALSGDTIAVPVISGKTTAVTISGTLSVTIRPGEVISNDGTVTDADGNVYRTVKIGNQEWMAENLRATKYRDGTPLPHASTAAWMDDTIPKFCYYGNTTNADSIRRFGALYNWYVVNPENPGKIAPAGWHVPSDAEWDTLENYLIVNGFNWDGTTTGNKIAKSLAAKTDWWQGSLTGSAGNSLTDNNRSGFSGYPGGEVGSSFGGIGKFGCFWSTTENEWSLACTRYLGSDNTDLVGSCEANERLGYSVRLVRD